MTAETSIVELPGLREGRFAGRSEFAEMIRHAFAAACAQGWREMMLFDADFNNWPLGERAVVQSLNDWSATGGKLTMMACNYDAVLRRHARFVTWRRTWAHHIDCRRSPTKLGGQLPSALWSSGWMFERFDVARCAGVAGSEVIRRSSLKERINECLLHGSPSFPATVLGL